MTPTKDHMNELWREMLAWPISHRMTMVACLAESCMDDTGDVMTDAHRPTMDGSPAIYVSAARGPAADAMRKHIRLGWTGDGDGWRTVKVGNTTAAANDGIEPVIEGHVVAVDGESK